MVLRLVHSNFIKRRQMIHKRFIRGEFIIMEVKMKSELKNQLQISSSKVSLPVIKTMSRRPSNTK